MTQTALRWTTDQPTVPGWYWFKYESDGRIEMLRVINPELPYLKLWVENHPWAPHTTNVEDFEGQWAGPIEPPE